MSTLNDVACPFPSCPKIQTNSKTRAPVRRRVHLSLSWRAQPSRAWQRLCVFGHDANAEYCLRTSIAFRDLYADDPLAVDRTLSLAERCNFSLNEIRYRYPAERLPQRTTSSEHLAHLTFEGARWRYRGDIPEDTRLQLKKELALMVLPLSSVGEMTLKLYGALSYSQNSARDLRFALNGA